MQVTAARWWRARGSTILSNGKATYLIASNSNHLHSVVSPLNGSRQTRSLVYDAVTALRSWR